MNLRKISATTTSRKKFPENLLHTVMVQSIKGGEPHSPESHRGDLSHQGVCGNTLKVKQGAVCQQQQHDVLAVAEALPTPANHRDILWPKQKDVLLACRHC